MDLAELTAWCDKVDARLTALESKGTADVSGGA